LQDLNKEDERASRTLRESENMMAARCEVLSIRIRDKLPKLQLKKWNSLAGVYALRM